MNLPLPFVSTPQPPGGWHPFVHRTCGGTQPSYRFIRGAVRIGFELRQPLVGVFVRRGHLHAPGHAHRAKCQCRLGQFGF